ncbi:MAG: PDGLE domain-containing protein [Caldisericia bacterium]|nr:PDGLE domain-containing protein [Caldisericia bacterium]
MKKYIIFGLLISMLIVLISPFASSFPDGLEKVSEIFNFSHKETSIIKSPMPDYTFPLTKNEIFSTILAGIIGALTTFVLLYFAGNLIKKRS